MNTLVFPKKIEKDIRHELEMWEHTSYADLFAFEKTIEGKAIRQIIL
jgi:hypothetical protein